MPDLHDDPNLQLAPFVEGLLMGAINLRQIEGVLASLDWKIEHADGDRMALVFVSPSGIRWRIKAVPIE